MSAAIAERESSTLLARGQLEPFGQRIRVVSKDKAKDHVQHQRPVEEKQGNGSCHRGVGDKGRMGDLERHGRIVLALLSVRSGP